MKKTLCLLTTLWLLGSTVRAQASSPALSVGVIDSRLFENPKEGIYKLVQLQKQVQREFQPQYKALDLLRKRAEILEPQVKRATGKAGQRQLEEYENLQRKIKRQTDEYERLTKESYANLMAPLQTRMTAAIKQWCLKNGYYLLLDIANDTGGLVMLADETQTGKNTAELIRYINSVL